jgi:hypothetical protein
MKKKRRNKLNQKDRLKVRLKNFWQEMKKQKIQHQQLPIGNFSEKEIN